MSPKTRRWWYRYIVFGCCCWRMVFDEERERGFVVIGRGSTGMLKLYILLGRTGYGLGKGTLDWKGQMSRFNAV